MTTAIEPDARHRAQTGDTRPGAADLIRPTVWRVARRAWVVGLVLAGCASPRQGAAPRAATQPAPPRENALLVAWIADQPYLTAEAAARAVWWLWQGSDGPEDFATLLERLRAGGIVPPGWHPQPGDRVRRATAGYMLARAIGLESGLNWRLLRLGRYAWRELIYRGIARPTGELGLVRGGEFLGLLQRAEQWMVEHGRATHPRAELGAPPSR